MTKEEKVNAVKGVIDSIYVYLVLTEEEVDYKVQTSYTGHSLYCKITQRTNWGKSFEYHIEYSTIIDFLTLEIHHAVAKATTYKNKIEKHVKSNSTPRIERLKESYSHKYIYKFNDIHLINSIAELMIDLSKSKQL